jgi:hypothetical protein
MPPLFAGGGTGATEQKYMGRQRCWLPSLIQVCGPDKNPLRIGILILRPGPHHGKCNLRFRILPKQSIHPITERIADPPEEHTAAAHTFYILPAENVLKRLTSLRLHLGPTERIGKPAHN